MTPFLHKFDFKNRKGLKLFKISFELYQRNHIQSFLEKSAGRINTPGGPHEARVFETPDLNVFAGRILKKKMLFGPHF